MRYKIEYLADSADAASVCYAPVTRAGSLDHAGRMAWDGATKAARLFGASGFQIRDMAKNGEIVATETLKD